MLSYHDPCTPKLYIFPIHWLPKTDIFQSTVKQGYYLQTINSRQWQEEKDRCTHHIKTEIWASYFFSTAVIDGGAPKTLTEKKLKSTEYLWIHLIPGHLRASSVRNPKSRSRSWVSTLPGSLATDTWLTPRPTQANSPRDHLRSGFGLWAWGCDLTLWGQPLIAFKRT